MFTAMRHKGKKNLCDLGFPMPGKGLLLTNQRRNYLGGQLHIVRKFKVSNFVNN
jgi:hypothetical protein